MKIGKILARDQSTPSIFQGKSYFEKEAQQAEFKYSRIKNNQAVRTNQGNSNNYVIYPADQRDIVERYRRL